MHPDGEAALDDGKTDVFSVPIIIDNTVQGYVVSQLAYTLDKTVKASVNVPVSYFINDEIFNQFYGHYSDVKDVQKVKFDDVRKSIIDRVNERFAQPLIKDLLVEQFNYITTRKSATRTPRVSNARSCGAVCTDGPI